VKFGDENTKLFHAIATQKHRKKIESAAAPGPSNMIIKLQSYGPLTRIDWVSKNIAA
jgi:hypothetical protein